MSIISDMIKFSRLAFGLRGFVKNTITLEESKQVITTRLLNRKGNFLKLIQKAVYQNPRSPYLKLLRLVGCEYGDVESAINRDGIETTLEKLLNQGVYLSWEEFKRKKEVVRGSNRFQFEEKDFDNPLLPDYYQIQSSGSRSAGTKTTFDLSHRLAMSYYRPPLLAVDNAGEFPLGLWYPVLPALSGIVNALYQSKAGKPAEKWFSPVEERQVQSSLRHRLAMRYIIYGSRLWGAKLPKPEYVSLEQAGKVAKWVAETREKSGGCSFGCYVSLAVKVCQAAKEHGLNIHGTRFIVGGEPLTDAKRQQIEAAGASVTNTYVISEIGLIGCSCPKFGTGDDVHLLEDSVALIQNKRKVEHTEICIDSFIFTPLLPSSPKVLINVESDDYGLIERRSCDCLFGQLGFDRHLSNIRSFSKLTGVGMTILGTDMVHILEEVLPRKYGGSATDYQLLEEEDGQGQTRLSLIINPAVGLIDESDIITTLLNELRKSPHPGKLSAGVWSQANAIRIKRMPPILQMGKVLTLNLRKKD